MKTTHKRIAIIINDYSELSPSGYSKYNGSRYNLKDAEDHKKEYLSKEDEYTEQRKKERVDIVEITTIITKKILD
jgi:hypothetical protein